MHIDIWGPSRNPNRRGGRYFLSIVDGYSRRVWVYILKIKDQDFEKFGDCHTTTEVKQGTKLKF